MMGIKGNLLNFWTDEIYPAEVEIENGIITCVNELNEKFDHFLLPGFIDAHIHIESSMLSPSRFAEAVIPHGTTGVITDPHEIANVMGLAGIQFMYEDAQSVPLNVYFTAPSCVPATPFESSGAIIGAPKIEKLLQKEYMVALGEMMNFPGVINDDPQVLEKINIALKLHKPVDGHAPLLSGAELCDYISKGISTDHECTSSQEALEKQRLGMKIMIREGSSAKNLNDLCSVGGEFLVSDDIHPQDLINGHVNLILRKAVKLGMNPFKAVKMVTINPSKHYNLPGGEISPGKPADITIVDNLENFNVLKVYIGGKLVASHGKALFTSKPLSITNSFHVEQKVPEDFNVYSDSRLINVNVIQVLEDQLLTIKINKDLYVESGVVQPDINEDIIKVAVVERYGANNVSNGFVRGFKIKNGALASSVSHDSHNIIVIGTDSKIMAKAVNLVLKNKGGLVAIMDKSIYSLKLPIGGLMSSEKVKIVAKNLDLLQNMVKEMGCDLKAPFMTMSFLALLVIPEIKISDQGLFDVEKFEFIDLINPK